MGKSFSLYSLLLPSHVSLLLTYKREGTQGNRGIFLLTHSTLMELSLTVLLLPSAKLGSYTHVRKLLLQEPHAHTTETWDQAPSLAILYRPTTNQCKQHEQNKLDVGYYSTEARTSINPCVPICTSSEALCAILDFICWRFLNHDTPLPIMIAHTAAVAVPWVI
jgi:hypothetical protein